MKIALAVLTDGRQPPTLNDTLRSALRYLPYIATAEILDDPHHALGLAGNVQRAWNWALEENADYLFHLEDDWEFLEPVVLDLMAACLEADPMLAQISLKRQPCNPDEAAAGGFMEMYPGQYVDTGPYCVHTRCFSLNPCLIPRAVLELGWPDGNEAEMTTLLVSKGYRFAVWGSRQDGPRVEHTGQNRAAGWRL